MYRALYSRILSLQPKFSTRLNTTIPYFYEMPECYRNSYFYANAPLHDNVNWFYYRGIEVAFNKIVENFRKLSPSSREEDVVRNVMNKINIMEYCSYVMEVNFPLMRDSGRIEIVKAFCAKHGVHYQKHLGGLRICETVDKSQMQALAALASFKNSSADLPFAGSYTGIKIDPSKYSANELLRLVSTFTKVITEKNFIGPQVNIFEPDLNCSEKLINIIAEQFVKLKGQEDLACITGKSLINGGLKNYNESKADGIFYGADKLINHDLISYYIKMESGWKNKTYIIKSLDQIGIQLVKLLNKHGAKCVGVSEADCSYYNTEGINIEQAIEYKKTHGSCKNYFPLYNEKKIMKERCDILIITDINHKIDYISAPDIEAKIIIEAACGAISPTAHKILTKKDKLVIPDVYINSGASIASYVEFVKNSSSKYPNNDTFKDILFSQSRQYLPRDKSTFVVEYKPEFETDNLEDDILKPTIEFRMSASAQKILKILREFNLDLDIRTATYIMASEKIFDVLQNDGIL